MIMNPILLTAYLLAAMPEAKPVPAPSRLVPAVERAIGRYAYDKVFSGIVPDSPRFVDGPWGTTHGVPE